MLNTQDIYERNKKQKAAEAQQSKEAQLKAYNKTLQGFLDLIHECYGSEENPKWELARYQHFEDARSFAIVNGWRSQKVQLKSVFENNQQWFIIEPFEEDCHCPGLIAPD